MGLPIPQQLKDILEQLHDRSEKEDKAYLCKQYGLTEKDVICHSEGYKLGIASNHGDVMHWFPRFGKSMDTFRAEATKATMLKGFDGDLFTRFVERIHVYSRTEIGFELKCGIILKERLVI